MTSRIHRMPFGAEPEPSGEFRFRLWAPSTRRVDLCLGSTVQEEVYPMKRSSEGWYELSVHAEAGDLYRYRIDNGLHVPDPASRCQKDDVHGPSVVVTPQRWMWTDTDWNGRPWEEAVIYELHVGTFSPEGTFSGAEQRLGHLVDLGVTAVELMPVSDFPGARNWGYDGVLPFAPDRCYGTPEDLKCLIQSAHARGLMVFLDVVYNHFGPDGNYLHAYCPQFFNERHQTPWGAAINFDGPGSTVVREFFIQNVLYWLEEYHLDGLRFDAVHAIHDDSSRHILIEIAERVKESPAFRRHVHLVLENDHNEARFLERSSQHQPRFFVAQWNDDIHHAFHVLVAGETSGYYMDYASEPSRHLGRCLTAGFAYQGDPSVYRHGALRGEPSSHLPSTAFVSFIQNHDQIGNRAFGDRISSLCSTEALRAITAMMILSPSPPLLFMGQEWASMEPFLFFCDFGGELRKAVTEGRRNEFARFPEFSDPDTRKQIPDPSREETFARSRLNWKAMEEEPHRSWFRFHQELLSIRRNEIVPRLAGIRGNSGSFTLYGERLILSEWKLGDGSMLRTLANLCLRPGLRVETPAGRILYGLQEPLEGLSPSPWSVYVFLEEAV